MSGDPGADSVHVSVGVTDPVTVTISASVHVSVGDSIGDPFTDFVTVHGTDPFADLVSNSDPEGRVSGDGQG